MNLPSENNVLPSNANWGNPNPDSDKAENKPNSSTVSAKPEPNIIEIEFIDLNLEPIAGLKYRLEYAKEKVSGTTDGSGKPCLA